VEQGFAQYDGAKPRRSSDNVTGQMTNARCLAGTMDIARGPQWL
jgi:hypothetical protein